MLHWLLPKPHGLWSEWEANDKKGKGRPCCCSVATKVTAETSASGPIHHPPPPPPSLVLPTHKPSHPTLLYRSLSLPVPAQTKVHASVRILPMCTHMNYKHTNAKMHQNSILLTTTPTTRVVSPPSFSVYQPKRKALAEHRTPHQLFMNTTGLQINPELLQMITFLSGT